MTPSSLVQPLFQGPVDIVGDVHGEIDAMTVLLGHLDYGFDGNHPDGRRLVFVGDLTDRGPDSPAVVDLVESLVNQRRAQCVLGNHDLNIMLGERKQDNHWFFGEHRSLDKSNEPTPAVLADDAIRRRVLEFFGSLPLALERDGLRVVHACWDDAMLEIARQADDTLDLYERYRKQIDAGLVNSNLDKIDRGLEHQNRNPVKVLTSGKEQRTAEPFEAGGKVRQEQRVRWWEAYDADSLCVFGHYATFKDEWNPTARAICIDFAVGKRWKERKTATSSGHFRSKLAAFRLPEKLLIFDDGGIERVKLG